MASAYHFYSLGLRISEPNGTESTDLQCVLKCSVAKLNLSYCSLHFLSEIPAHPPRQLIQIHFQNALRSSRCFPRALTGRIFGHERHMCIDSAVSKDWALNMH